MDEQELERIEGMLRDALAGGGLGWVVAQVDELVVEGVYEVAAKHRGGAETREKVERPSDARRGASSVRPYEIDEGLTLLISCARRALIDGQQLEDAVDDLLLTPDPDGRDRGPQRGHLEFFDERTGQTVSRVSHTDDRTTNRKRSDTIAGQLDVLATNLGLPLGPSPEDRR